MKIAYFDCFAGISGDMTLGALIGAGADAEDLRRALQGLKLEGFTLEVGRRMAGPIAATDVRVIVAETRHPHHRRLRDILALIEAADLSERVKSTASGIFRRLAQAEGKVHGVAPEEIHFHEVGAVDAVVDIVGAAVCLEMLGWPKVVASPLPTFHGFAKGSHGTFPLPAPATAELLVGVPWRSLDLEGELVTPTGAAILREIASEFGPLPAMRIERIGYGAGKNTFSLPNALRVFLGEAEPRPCPGGESVTVMETNIDDLNPLFYERTMERLLAAGALDVFLTPVQMKKNRPGTLLTVLCPEELCEALAEIIFSETSTLGVRLARWERICLERHWQEVTTAFGPIRVKIALRNGRVVTASPEYEDCRRAACEHNVPLRQVHEAALIAYRGENL